MNLLLTIHILITIALIAIILLQKSEGGGGLMGGSGSGAGNSMFTARGAANLLTRITAVLAVLFIGNCILMTIITSSQLRQATSLLDTKKPEAPQS